LFLTEGKAELNDCTVGAGNIMSARCRARREGIGKTRAVWSIIAGLGDTSVEVQSTILSPLVLLQNFNLKKDFG
jgi:hypothetical protein